MVRRWPAGERGGDGGGAAARPSIRGGADARPSMRPPPGGNGALWMACSPRPPPQGLGATVTSPEAAPELDDCDAGLCARPAAAQLPPPLMSAADTSLKGSLCPCALAARVSHSPRLACGVVHCLCGSSSADGFLLASGCVDVR